VPVGGRKFKLMIHFFLPGPTMARQDLHLSPSTGVFSPPLYISFVVQAPGSERVCIGFPPFANGGPRSQPGGYSTLTAFPPVDELLWWASEQSPFGDHGKFLETSSFYRLFPFLFTDPLRRPFLGSPQKLYRSDSHRIPFPFSFWQILQRAFSPRFSFFRRGDESGASPFPCEAPTVASHFFLNLGFSFGFLGFVSLSFESRR